MPDTESLREDTPVEKLDLIFININANSDVGVIRMSADKSVGDAVMQVADHVAKGLYTIVSLNASKHSCVVVISTEKQEDELLWKNGFPWERTE